MRSNETLINIQDVRKIKDVPGHKEINLMCIDLSHYSTVIQITCCCIVVFVCYLAYGYFLELLFSGTDVKPVSLYITFVQFLITTLLAKFESLMKNTTKRNVPIRTYATLAGLTLGTMVFSNLALGYLNYPTQLIFKSCKLIPVMIGSIIILGKRYNFVEYCAAVIMCLGLTMFTLADSKTSPKFETTGVLVICVALTCDAIIGNLQEKVMRQFVVTNNEIVFHSYAIASVYLLLYMVPAGVLRDGYRFCADEPARWYVRVWWLSVSGYCGLAGVLTLVRVCGAPVTVTLTTMRKALSILLSFLLFRKPFVFQYAWSGLLVALAIYLSVVGKGGALGGTVSVRAWWGRAVRCVRGAGRVWCVRRAARHTHHHHYSDV